MKKLFAILTMAAVLCVSSASIFASHSAYTEYDISSHKEYVKISGLDVSEQAVIAVEVWDSKYNLAWNSASYTRSWLFGSSSKACSVKNSGATRGYRAFFSKDWLGNLGVYSKGAWESNRVK